jgi:hypothetical protein
MYFKYIYFKLQKDLKAHRGLKARDYTAPLNPLALSPPYLLV